MKITQYFDTTHNLIKSFSDEGITIGDQQYNKSIIITADSLDMWAPVMPDMLVEQDFKLLDGLRPELVILGTGNTLRFPDISISAHFMQQGIGFEVMDTAAACRTYNVLVSEGRRVAAALVLVVSQYDTHRNAV